MAAPVNTAPAFVRTRAQGRAQATIKRNRALASLVVSNQPSDYRVIRLPSKDDVCIDIDDYDLATSRAWYKHSQGYTAAGSSTTGHQYLHRLVLERVIGRQLTRKDVVDHINHDKLDNRRANLRLATASLNGANMVRPSHNSSGYKGVHWSQAHNRWHSSIKVQQTELFIGLFQDLEEAAYAYDQVAMQLFNEFAKTNFEY
jgi:hypothetical protein